MRPPVLCRKRNADRYEREAQERAERDWNSDERRVDGGKLAAETASESRVEGDDAGLDCDSSGRRHQFAAIIEGKVDQRTIDARILADGENAKHPRGAVVAEPGRAVKPRKKAKGVVRHRIRASLAR